MAKNKPDIWMPIYIGDYLADTMHLSTEMHGAYLLLLMAYWRNGGPLPGHSIQGITRLTDHAWSNQQAVLQAFFKIDENGFWFHKRVNSELDASRGKKAKAVEKAKKAAQVRHDGKNNKIAWSNQQAMLGAINKQCLEDTSSSSSSHIKNTTPLPPRGGVCVEQGNFELQPQDGGLEDMIPKSTSGTCHKLLESKPELINNPEKKYVYPPDFETFWSAYPNGIRGKQGKKAAERAWKARKKEGALPPLPDVLRAVEAQKNAPGWQRDGGQYIPNPATWLNQGRWDDELGKNVKSGADDGISPELRDMLERRRMERENANR